jgi:protein-tyrosine kinase
MEQIRKAVERAKGPGVAQVQQLDPGTQQHVRPNVGAPDSAQRAAKGVALNGAYLETKRIVAHDIADPRSKSFDMLRTQVLQSMDVKSWQFLGITSPTEACGKSVISTNLALSIARQPERSVLLLDMDLQKPQVASNLGLRCDRGLMSILDGRTNLQNSLIQAHIRNENLLVLPCEASTQNSSEWVASRAMSAVLQEIRRDFRARTVIIDLPPILASDDVISILPQLDCILFVVAAGTTTAQEIKDCNKHLESTEVLRVVLNKAEDATATYYSYSRYAQAPRQRSQQSKVPPLKRMSQLFARLTGN